MRETPTDALLMLLLAAPPADAHGRLTARETGRVLRGALWQAEADARDAPTGAAWWPLVWAAVQAAADPAGSPARTVAALDAAAGQLAARGVPLDTDGTHHDYRDAAGLAYALASAAGLAHVLLGQLAQAGPDVVRQAAAEAVQADQDAAAEGQGCPCDRCTRRRAQETAQADAAERAQHAAAGRG